MTAAMPRPFVRAHSVAGWSYSTPAGLYTIAGAGCVWQLSSPGQVLGTYATVELAEAALDADVKNRMWS